MEEFVSTGCNEMPSPVRNLRLTSDLSPLTGMRLYHILSKILDRNNGNSLAELFVETKQRVRQGNNKGGWEESERRE
eukprot:316969-Hanusia_phi.AAC.3